MLTVGSLLSSTSSLCYWSSSSSSAPALTHMASSLPSWTSTRMGISILISFSLGPFADVRSSFTSVFWRAARIGERLSPYISVCCVVMAVSIAFLPISIASLTSNRAESSSDRHRCAFLKGVESGVVAKGSIDQGEYQRPYEFMICSLLSPLSLTLRIVTSGPYRRYLCFV